MAETTGARLVWSGGLRFTARGGTGGEIVTESPAEEERRGPSPVELVVMGVAGCTGIDVVSILARMRQPLDALEIEVVGQRAATHPKYITAVELVYRVHGHGLSREKVERAIELSHSTYCSASASLRPDCPVTWRLELRDGE